jgi:hypothetical protein
MAETVQINELTIRIAYSLVRWFRINLTASFVLAGGGHLWWLQSLSESNLEENGAPLKWLCLVTEILLNPIIYKAAKNKRSSNIRYI